MAQPDAKSNFGTGPTPVAVIANSGTGKTSVIERLVAGTLVSADVYAAMHTGTPVPARELEAYKLLRR
jgi:molybdopterin-guanine dinucleotide biosynthesis protein